MVHLTLKKEDHVGDKRLGKRNRSLEEREKVFAGFTSLRIVASFPSPSNTVATLPLEKSNRKIVLWERVASLRRKDSELKGGGRTRSFVSNVVVN